MENITIEKTFTIVNGNLGYIEAFIIVQSDLGYELIRNDMTISKNYLGFNIKTNYLLFKLKENLENNNPCSVID